MNNYILFTLLSFMILVESKIVVVEHGEITITEDTNCTFNCNGITIQSKSGKVPGLWFGFIEYNCSNIMGSIISNFECKQCGLFCVYNQIIPGCSQDAFLIVIGVIIGSIIMLPFIILIAVKWHLFFDFILSKIIMLKTKMTIDKKFRRAKKYGKMTGNKVRIDVEVGNNLMKEADKERVSNHRGKVLNKLIDKGIEMKDDNYDIIKDAKENIFPMRNFDPSIIVELSETIRTGSMIRESKLKKLDVPASAPEYITVVDKPSTSKRPVTPPRIHSRRNSSSDMINRKKMMAALTAGILLGTPGSHACDKSIYINSAGRICDVNNCYDTPMASFPLTTGQLICYKDVNGSIFNIKITNAYYRDRYQLLYYTSDYEIKYDTYRRCLGTDECGPNKNCYKGSIGSRFNTNESKIEGYDCFDGEYSCDNFCFRQATCSWVKWWLLDDKIMYPVYIKVTSIWEVELMITYHNIKKIVKVNVNNPTIDVSDFNSLGLKDIPIYVNGFTSEVISIPNGIIIHDSKAYITKVSELNMPETNIIGDYQISIDGSNKIYDTNSVICRTTQCTTKCHATESKIKRFIRKIQTNKLESTSYSLINGDRTLETRTNVNAMINIMIGNLDIANLYAQPAHCDVDVAMTYACIGCTTKPYVVFKSRLIKHEGSLKFESNCTFSRNYLSCNSEMYKITLEDDNKSCYIHVPSINKTLNINLNYVFTGRLDNVNLAPHEDSSLTSLKEIVTSESFMKGIFSTLIGYSLISLVIASILRGYKIYMINKAVDKTNAKV